MATLKAPLGWLGVMETGDAEMKEERLVGMLSVDCPLRGLRVLRLWAL